MNISHLHPLTVHFPVSLIIVGFFLEILSLYYKKENAFSKASLYLMILGTLGAVVAVVTGDFFTEELKGAAHDVQENHELFANLTMYTMLAATLFRLFLIWKKKENTSLRWIYFSLFAVGVIFVGYAGYLGGTLVYNYMIHP